MPEGDPEKETPEVPEPDVKTWVASVYERIKNRKQGDPAVNIHERLVAFGYELAELKPDKQHQHHKYMYFSIGAVTMKVNRLQAKYRILISPTLIKTEHIADSVEMWVEFDAYCWETDEHHKWTWADDGADLTKASAFVEKYAMIRHFHVGDGEDPDSADDRAKRRDPAPARGNSTQRMSGGGASIGTSEPSAPAPEETSSGSTVSQDKWTEVFQYLTDEKNLPAKAMWRMPKVVAVLGAYEAKKRQGKLSETEKTFGSSQEFVLFELGTAHANNCKEKPCEHIVKAYETVGLPLPGGEPVQPNPAPVDAAAAAVAAVVGATAEETAANNSPEAGGAPF